MTRRPPEIHRCWLLAVLGALLLLTASARAYAWGTDSAAMADRIAALIKLRPGSSIAEIGAGHGYMAVRMAEKVGPAGHLYATEIDLGELTQIKHRAATAGLANLSAIQGSDTATGLPPQCCSAIYLIGVYHHFANPAALDRSMFEALKPGGRLFVSDFYPTWLFAFWTTPAMRRNFGGHGVAQALLERQLTAAGFRMVTSIDGYPHSFLLRNYSVVVEKPASSGGLHDR